MADEESLLSLAADEVAVAAFLAEHGGHLARHEADAATYWLTMQPASAPQESYYVRLVWTAYPYQAPSVKFADGIGGSVTVTRAWPVIPGYRPASFDICKPMTAEGYGLHREWQQGSDAWPVTGNPFMWVVEILQFDLDHDYAGRAA